jgi:chemotaxis signal transduction protein
MSEKLMQIHELFLRPIPVEERLDYESQYAQNVSSEDSVIRTFFVFKIKNNFYGLSPEKITAISSYTKVRILPGRSRLHGVVSIRGEILPVPKIFSDVYTSERTNDIRSLVIESSYGKIVIHSNEVLGIIKINANKISTLPSSFNLNSEIAIESMFNDGRVEIAILDFAKLDNHIQRCLV